MSQLELSSILNMLDDVDSIRKTLRSMRAQTARNRLEVVIVTTHDKVPTIPASLFEGLGGYQIVGVDKIESGAHGWAAGIKVAKSPIVVMSEDHGFPAPNWAETLIDAHKGDYAAVCPAIDNGNPQTACSWANFALCFIDFFAPDRSQEVAFGPGHNSSYKRELLMSEYGDRLEYWLNPERVLFFDFAAKGRKTLLDARTSVGHVNISKLNGYLSHSFQGGRVFGGSRAENWGLANKLIHAAAFPLVPLIRIHRIMPFFNTPEKKKKAKLGRTLPLIMLGLLYHAIGEVAGYLFGSGDAMKIYMDFELRRRDWVQPGEFSALSDPMTPPPSSDNEPSVQAA